MSLRSLFTFSWGLLALGLLASLTAVCADPPAESKPLQISMIKTFFNDIPKVFVEIAIEPFGQVMKTATTLEGQLTTQYDAFETAQKLDDGQLHFGVFHGHEFAWVQQKHPKLVPLMVAVNRHRDVRTFLIVHKDSPVKSLADLRGKKLDMPRQTKEHCRIYLDKHCTDNAQSDPRKFFGAIVSSASAEEALDDVCRGKSQATIVDAIGLEFYKYLKEPCYDKNLRILQQSEPFPPAVIVYKQGVLSDSTLTKFRDGLFNAHNTDLGREMMKMWKIEAFEQVPSNYTKMLADVLKGYPAPEIAKVSLR